jgi:hypothetical protein
MLQEFRDLPGISDQVDYLMNNCQVGASCLVSLRSVICEVDADGGQGQGGGGEGAQEERSCCLLPPWTGIVLDWASVQTQEVWLPLPGAWLGPGLHCQ